jgi:hypothetical protein
VHINGPWKVVAEKSLPRGLRSKKKVKGKPKGPPPHAPAHGYRHKYHEHGVELVYDSGRGVYVVVDLPNHFYFKGHYYRRRESRWEIGVHINGPWKVVAEKSLPRGLRSKKKGKGKPKGPPPHAPEHGYRYKYQEHGVELVYDSGRGVYVVVDLPNHFYFKEHYYRRRETQWEIGVRVDGPWKVVAEESLPKGLRSKKKGKGKDKGKPEEHPGKGVGLGKKKNK